MNELFTTYFWGVRGSIASPGPETVRYGGNTTCVEMKVGGKQLIFDAGTGIRGLGQSMLSQVPIEAHIFFTHTHWDHIQGFPFFTPAFTPGNKFHIYGVPSPLNGDTIEKRLSAQMHHPNFPVPLARMGASLKFYDLEIGQKIILDDITISSAQLYHPGGATGYRVNWRGYSAAYITDTEHFPDKIDPNVLYLANEVDLLIIDAAYTNEEYHAEPPLGKKGWGHSTWEEAIKIAIAAKVKKLVIFHHDPLHNDDFLDKVGEKVAQQFPNSLMAREGLAIPLIPPNT